MDATHFLDQLLKSSKDFASQGRDLAEEKLGLPESGAQREAMVSGLQKGAVAGGLVALLLGTGLGRRLTGKAVKYGTLAALGGVAYKAYQNWQGQRSPTSEPPELPPPISELSGQLANRRSLALIRAMMAAAKADGELDKAEQTRITEQLQKLELDDETRYLLHAELDGPLDVAAVAAGADSQLSAAEIYVASRIVIDTANPRETQYLSQLADALALSPELVQQLEAEAAAEA